MKISAKGEYACMALLELAFRYRRNRPVPIRLIAERQKIPRKFLVQILSQLRQAGLVGSRKGREGGYFLTQPPSRIMLGEVIRVIEGPLVALVCLEDAPRERCSKEASCGFKLIWKEVQEAMAGVIDHVSFEDICNITQKMKGSMYYI